MKQMSKNHRKAPTRILLASACLALALGCGLHKATVAVQEGRYDDALTEYRKALQKDPNNLQAKIGYRRAAPLAAEHHLLLAKEAQRVGNLDVEAREVGMAVTLDPANAVASDWMARIEQALERRQAKLEAEDSIDAQRAKGESKRVLPINPRSLEGMDLNFTRKTSLKEIFQQLSKNSGVNIVLHSSVSGQDQSISVDLRGLTFQRVLDTLMLQSDLFYKVLDGNTIMVFKKTPQNLQEYENKLIRTFYLSNAEVENVRQIFNALMPQLRVFIDKRLNAITVMAKPTDLSIAQRIVNQLDKAKAEVMVYLELMETSEQDAEKLGLLPVVSPTDTTGTYSLGVTTLNTNSLGLNTNTGSLSIKRSNLQYLLPSIRLDMLKSSGQTRLLANPNIRVISGETGEVNIGDKISTTQSQLGLPTSTSSSTTTSTTTAASSYFATAQTSYSYEDVGVKIKVKPRVHFNGDITLELESEIKTQKQSGSGDPNRPNLSQRVIKTVARLRDGETAIFGGLLKDEEKKGLQGIWGLSSIPVIKDILGYHANSNEKTDVILSVRAVVVRKPDLAEADFEAFDPDLAPNQAKPFAPPPAKQGLNVPMNAQPGPAAPPASQPPAPADQPPADQLPAPTDQPTAPADQPPAPADGFLPGPATSGQPAVPPAAAKPASPEADAGDLVFFMDPLSREVTKDQSFQVTLFASGARGLTSGSLTLGVDPKLVVAGVAPGDFLTGDGGTLTSAPGKNGTLVLTFQRKTGAMDSGTFAVLDLRATASGNAPILVQGGQYLVGSNPIPARVVNSLITVN